MNEATCKSELARILRREYAGAVVLRHEDKFRFGVPDMSITYMGWTSWWEAKYANPSCDSPGIQQLTMRKLDIAAFSRYLIFHEGPSREERQVHIVRPVDYVQWMTMMEGKKTLPGFDYSTVAANIIFYHMERKLVHDHRRT